MVEAIVVSLDKWFVLVRVLMTFKVEGDGLSEPLALGALTPLLSPLTAGRGR